ncbi:MAG: 4Fe-4S binding protein [Deltaproteobacteria bacterium]|nr:4Fe-4S binding protein [Deltaproteobacteria bacterium]
MNALSPVYTEKAECQDCYRCLRNCPVKAIKIEQGVASVLEELCIHCGKCVAACPRGAKKVRNDIALAEKLFASGKSVIASIAPSFRSEFDHITDHDFIYALKQLGFSGVSETALGAEEVSGHVYRLLNESSEYNEPMISTACPVVVNYIRKYYPSLTRLLSPVLSPMLSHSKLLKEIYPDSAVVFFGPCIAKKDEIVQYPNLCDCVLTFQNLRTMFEQKGITFGNGKAGTDIFTPRKAQEGTVYPVDGGMIAGIRGNGRIIDRHMMHFSGLPEIESVLNSLSTLKTEEPLFLELLACPGGCINGPVAQKDDSILSKRISILRNTEELMWRDPAVTVENVEGITEPFEIPSKEVSDEDIIKVLRATGKYTPEDEHNCGGCGYLNCRDFAKAVVEGRAETAMCVTYMRKLASKKANKLISAIPLGVVIVDTSMRIIECNERFAILAGDDAMTIFEQRPGMAGAVLDKVLPVGSFFRHVLESEEDISSREININNRLLRCTIFTIEPGLIAGGIFSDITDPEMQREEIIKRARSVIRKNLSTVQKIAYLLGENASETEMVLSGIIECFGPQDQEE